MGRSGECFRDDQAPCLHGLGGLMWMWRPGVVMSDAAEPVGVHTLRRLSRATPIAELHARWYQRQR